MENVIVGILVGIAVIMLAFAIWGCCDWNNWSNFLANIKAILIK